MDGFGIRVGTRSTAPTRKATTPNTLPPPRELRDFLQAGVKELGVKELGARTRLVALVATTARGKGGGVSPAAPAARPTRAAPGPTAGVPRQLRDFLTAGASEVLDGSRRRTVKNFPPFGKRDVSPPTPRPRAKPEERAAVAVRAGRPQRTASKPDGARRISTEPLERRPTAAALAVPAPVTSPSDGAAAAARPAALPVVSVGIPLPEHWPTPLLPSAVLGAALLPASPNAVASAREAPCPAAAPQQPPPRGKAGARAKRCVCGAADKSKWSVACKGCDRICHGECVGADPALHHPERAAAAAPPPPPRRGKRKAQEEPGEWHCRDCLARLKRRRREEEEFAWADRAERYCVCARPWDGCEFMIACDECSVWYHGACVGISVATIEAGTQAAFRRYVCPKCAPPPVAPGQGVRLYAEDAAPSPPGSPGSKAAGKLHLTPTSAAGFSTGAAALPGACDASAGPSALAWLAEAAAAMRSANTPTRHATPPAHPPPREEASPTRIGLLDALSDDCLAAVLAQLPLPSLLLCAVPLSRRVAELAEPLFRAECEARGWKLQRRLAAAPCPWRRTLRARSCAVCLARSAPFAVRRPSATATAFRLCATCARRDDVHEQLGWHSLEVDSVGDQGQPLFSRQFHTPLFGHADGFSQRSIQRG